MLMKRPYLLFLLFWGLLMVHQTARADNEVVFEETFDGCNDTGGNDGVFTGSVGFGEIVCDNNSWDFYNCYGADKCLKFGSSASGASGNGIFSTPFIFLGGLSATLTFKAAGWGDATTDKLSVEAVGCTITGNTTIKKLNDGSWDDTYTVSIKDITGPVRFSFTGKRGFIDDIKVVGERGSATEVTVPAPTLTDEFTFWPNTIEPTRRTVVITPPAYSRVRYTLDGSEPSLTEGTEIRTATNVYVWETATVKAINIQSGYTSDIVSKTYTYGQKASGIAGFKELAEDTEAQLFLSVEQNAKVTAVDGKQFTIKDDTGATLLFDFGTVAYNPTPAVDQLVAGWITGKKQTVGGQATFIAISNTTPKYMAFANPVKDITGIETVATTKEATSDAYYTLSGIRVKAPKKGLYIANGKKLIIH